MKRIKVTFEMDPCGNLVMTPLSRQLRRRIVRYLKEWKVNSDGTAFVQEDYNVESALERYLNPSQRRDVQAGWPVTVLVDPWTWLHHIGWDAHEGVKA